MFSHWTFHFLKKDKSLLYDWVKNIGHHTEPGSEDSIRLSSVAMASRQPFNPLQAESSQRGWGESQMCYHLCSSVVKISTIASELILPTGLGRQINTIIPFSARHLLPTFRIIIYQPISPSLKSHQCLIGAIAHFVVVTLCYPWDTKTALRRASEARTRVGDVRNAGRLNMVRI